jgi:hypothetical protein
MLFGFPCAWEDFPGEAFLMGFKRSMLRRFWRNRSNLFVSPYFPNRPDLPISFKNRDWRP